MTHTEKVPYNGYVYEVEFDLDIGKMPAETEIEVLSIQAEERNAPEVHLEEMELHLLQIWDEIVILPEKRFDTQ
jgi:hypothetical protein